MADPLACQHEAFAIPDGITYLNAAYMGPLSHAVVAAGHAGLERKMRPWTITTPDFFVPVEGVREAFAQVIGGDADGVAVLPAVSYGVAVVAANVNGSPKDRIVCMAEQFPSNMYSWHDLAARTGAEVVTVQRPAGGDWTSALVAGIDDRTSVVSIEPCHWTDGGLVDVIAVGARAREVGAVFVVDATQWIGAAPFDVGAVRPDYLITAAYKWLLGPYGCALMWCAPDRRTGRPLELSWITRSRSEDFAGLIEYDPELRSGARRFDVGQTSNFALIPSVRAALDQTLGWGVDRICAAIVRLVDLIADRARDLGLAVPPGHLRAPHLLGVHLGDADPEAVAAALADSNVHVSVRGRAMRVSPHVYNDESDVDRLFVALKSAL